MSRSTIARASSDCSALTIPTWPLHVAGGIDDAVLAAEVGELLAHLAQLVLGQPQLLAGELDRVLMRLVGELVDHLARFGEDLLGDGVGVLGGEGVHPHLDDAGVGEVDRDHPPPVGEQILDRGVLAEREPDVLGVAVVTSSRRSSLASAISTMRWLRMKSKSTLMSEAVPEPIWVMAPRMPAAAALSCSERTEKAVVE